MLEMNEVEIVAAWRLGIELPEEVVLSHRRDFSGFDLSGLDLSGKRFFHAKMVGANFQGANLQGADLRGVNLQGVNLTLALLPDNWKKEVAAY